MAIVFEETFDSGVDGTEVLSGNSAFSWISTTRPLYSATNPAVGPLCMYSGTQAYGQASVGGLTTFYMRAYIRLSTLGAITWIWNVLTSAPAVLATLRVNNNGTLRIMPGQSGTLIDTTAALVAGEWARVEWAIMGTDMQVRMFLGANVHGETPDYDSDPFAWTGAVVSDSQIGAVSASTLGVSVDSFVVDNAGWVGPDPLAVVPEPLATPNVSVSSSQNPSAHGASDGSITVTWPSVPGAASYVAEIASGLGAPSGFTTVSQNATSPFTFTDLAGGDYTVGITAHPPVD